MKIIKIAAIATIILPLTACSGMKFRSAAVNEDLPDDWKGRTLMKNVADFRFFMKENVGLLVSPSADNTYTVLGAPIIPDGLIGREETIKDGGVYSSRITSAASTKGGYLTFAASLDASQALNYQIVDISRVDIPWVNFPASKIRAASAAPNPSGKKRLWIQSLILSRILKTSATKVECNMHGAGPAFQVGATCFNEDEKKSNDFAIAAVFVDIDKWVADNPLGTIALGDSVQSVVVSGYRKPSIAQQINTVLLALKSKFATPEDKQPILPEYISIQEPGGEINGFLKSN